jgi:hypothetical protein
MKNAVSRSPDEPFMGAKEGADAPGGNDRLSVVQRCFLPATPNPCLFNDIPLNDG